MADVVLTKQEIRPGMVERLRQWTEEIQDREDEALETLGNEGMHLEAAFVEHTDVGEFLVYFMKADDVDAVFEAFEESDHDIDREHAAVLGEVLTSPERVGRLRAAVLARQPGAAVASRSGTSVVQRARRASSSSEPERSRSPRATAVSERPFWCSPECSEGELARRRRRLAVQIFGGAVRERQRAHPTRKRCYVTSSKSLWPWMSTPSSVTSAR